MNDYKKIIKDNTLFLDEQHQCWSDFLFHYSDITNVVNILRCNCIYSRNVAKNYNLMNNDNASENVMQNTFKISSDNARLYFRPKTPTQYYNEGFKPKKFREKYCLDASCPVPVFLCLDINNIMSLDNVQFSEKGIAGQQIEALTGYENFKMLNFEKIYQQYKFENQNDNPYKRAEVFRKEFPLLNNIKAIVCRSIAEKEYLLYELLSKDKKTYETYKWYIGYYPNLDFFYKNGVYIDQVILTMKELNFQIATNYYNKTSIRYNAKIHVDIYDYNSFITSIEDSCTLEYCASVSCNLDFEFDNNITFSRALISIYFDDELMYRNMKNVENIEL